MKNRYDIIIIGCGTSAGFFLVFLKSFGAIKKRKRILLLEKNKEPFKKIYASGNGRCNFSNINITPDNYYSFTAGEKWRNTVFDSVKKLDLKKYFLERGVPSNADEYGRLMPFTNSSKTIGAFFENNLAADNIEFKNYAKVSTIIKKSSGAYTVKWSSKAGHSSADSNVVVFSAGGSAYPQLGTDGSAFAILKEFGHTVTDQVAGIVPLETLNSPFRKLAGLKMECEMSFEDKFKRKGEILFTKYGVSGPNVLYASNIISMRLLKGPVDIKVNFLPGLSLDYFVDVFKNSPGKTVKGVFGGSLSADFIEAFIICMPGGGSSYKNNIEKNHIEKIYGALTNFKLTILKTRGFKEAQVSIGGVKPDEIDPISFESNLSKKLYILGEAVDYTGGCGGYNIHWCAATAKAAAEAVAGAR